MRFGIVRFPGSNCDADCERAVTEGLGQEAVYLWHKTPSLENVDVVLLPGGFSYGDHLRAGAIARFSPIMREVIAFAQDGKPVVGICNGFQILCEAHLLPGGGSAHQARFSECPLPMERVSSSRTMLPSTNSRRRGELCSGTWIVMEIVQARQTRTVLRMISRASVTRPATSWA